MTHGVLLDANLLCLLAVGRIDLRSIASHPRLRAFTSDDFKNVVAVIARLGEPVLCPHVLTETSNLLGYRQDPSNARRWRQSLAKIVERTTERSHPAKDAVADGDYLRLGMTDAVLLALSNDRGLTLVSDDLHLCLASARRGFRSINYNHLRTGALTIDQL